MRHTDWHSFKGCITVLAILPTVACGSLEEAEFRDEYIALYCSTADACEPDHPMYMEMSECVALGESAVDIAEAINGLDTAGAQNAECSFNEDNAKECLKDLEENQKNNDIAACNHLLNLTACQDIYTDDGCN